MNFIQGTGTPVKNGWYNLITRHYAVSLDKVKVDNTERKSEKKVLSYHDNDNG